MIWPPSGVVEHVRTRLEAYYTRYYRDALGIPSWRELVAVRLDDERYEGQRLSCVEGAVGGPLAGCRLLNVGCGTGGFNAVAERSGALTWGVDTDPEAVAIARQRAREPRVLQASAEALPFLDRSFDVVYCYSTLEHVDDAERVVRELVRVLRPNGVLYLHTPHRWACFETHYKVFWIPGLPRWLGCAYLAVRGRPTSFFRTLKPLTLGECCSLLERAGARVTRVLDGGSNRPAGRMLWPLVRLYYRVSGIRPSVELVARRTEAA